MERQRLLEVYFTNLVGLCDDAAKLNVLVQQAVHPLAKYIYIYIYIKHFKNADANVCFLGCLILIILTL